MDIVKPYIAHRYWAESFHGYKWNLEEYHMNFIWTIAAGEKKTIWSVSDGKSISETAVTEDKDQSLHQNCFRLKL